MSRFIVLECITSSIILVLYEIEGEQNTIMCIMIEKEWTKVFKDLNRKHEESNNKSLIQDESLSYDSQLLLWHTFVSRPAFLTYKII